MRKFLSRLTAMLMAVIAWVSAAPDAEAITPSAISIRVRDPRYQPLVFSVMTPQTVSYTSIDSEAESRFRWNGMLLISVFICR